MTHPNLVRVGVRVRVGRDTFGRNVRSSDSGEDGGGLQDIEKRTQKTAR